MFEIVGSTTGFVQCNIRDPDPLSIKTDIRTQNPDSRYIIPCETRSVPRKSNKGQSHLNESQMHRLDIGTFVEIIGCYSTLIARIVRHLKDKVFEVQYEAQNTYRDINDIVYGNILDLSEINWRILKVVELDRLQMFKRFVL